MVGSLSYKGPGTEISGCCERATQSYYWGAGGHATELGLKHGHPLAWADGGRRDRGVIPLGSLQSSFR